MKVQELIKKLQEFNPETEVIFSCEIENGRSSSYVGNGNCSVDFEEEYVFETEIEDEKNEFENVVVFRVWGEESCWD